jgi:hypothetical protein
MALGLIVNTGRILTAKLLMGQDIEGLTHCAIGDGDATFADPMNPPDPVSGQTALIERTRPQALVQRTFLKEHRRGRSSSTAFLTSRPARRPTSSASSSASTTEEANASPSRNMGSSAATAPTWMALVERYALTEFTTRDTNHG